MECSVVSLLLQEGLIINLGSVAALEPMKSTPVYAASKWGLRGWSLSCYEVTPWHTHTQTTFYLAAGLYVLRHPIGSCQFV